MTSELSTEQALASKVRELLLEAEDWDDALVLRFTRCLVDVGITDADTLEHRLVLSSNDPRPYTDLGWNHYYDWEDMGDELTSLKGIVIDWEMTYNTYLSHIYSDFHFNRRQYFFRRD